MRQSETVEQPPVKVLYITTVPESLGFLKGQAQYLQSRGVTVYALSSPGKALEKYAVTESVPVYAVNMPRRITPLHDLVAVIRIWNTLRRLRPQVVHALTPKAGLLGMISARLARTPVRIYHVLGLPMMTAKKTKRRLLRLTEKTSCLLANQVLCVSHSMREVLTENSLCPIQKVKVLANGSINGVDSEKTFNPARLDTAMRCRIREEYGVPADANVIGYLGRVVRDKGLIELSQAWQMIASRDSNSHLLIVGQSESQDPLPAEVQHYLNTEPRIHMIGYVEDSVPFYRAMDVLVLPTYREGFPVAPLEAAAMELPVVATRIPGCVEAVDDGATGILVPPYNAQALAKAIQVYLDDPELRRRHGQAGRKRVLRNFQPQLIWQSIYDEYKRLLQIEGICIPTNA